MFRNEKCIHCQGRKICRDETISWIFVIIGLVSTVAIRIVTLLMNWDPLYGKIAWYIGVIGFTIFFIYKYKVFASRSEIIDKHNLVDKISRKQALTDNDYEVIGTILCKIRSNKERINFFFIFLASAIALVLALYFDFLR